MFCLPKTAWPPTYQPLDPDRRSRQESGSQPAERVDEKVGEQALERRAQGEGQPEDQSEDAGQDEQAKNGMRGPAVDAVGQADLAHTRVGDGGAHHTANPVVAARCNCQHRIVKVGGQAVLGRQNILPTPWLTERHGYDPTSSGRCGRSG